MDDVFLGIDKRADVPDHFKDARLEAYPQPKYGIEQACIQAPENALILSLIQERDDLGAADAAPITFVAFLSAATEYPASFFATGNPRPIAERWSMPVIPADGRKISTAHLTRMPLLEEISRAFAVQPISRKAPGLTLPPKNVSQG